MQKFVNQTWNRVAAPDVFQFQSTNDMNEILYSGPYTINNKPMILKPWTVDFDFNSEFLTEIPLWVKLPNLPMSYVVGVASH